MERPFRLHFWPAACIFLAVAVFFLWQEHRAHILGILPYALLLLCLLSHRLMHHRHDHHDYHSGGDGGREGGRS